MDVYKVDFENNLAVSANRISVGDYLELKELGVENSKTVMKWCIVDADHEGEAIHIANETVKERWGSILGLR